MTDTHDPGRGSDPLSDTAARATRPNKLNSPLMQTIIGIVAGLCILGGLTVAYMQYSDYRAAEKARSDRRDMAEQLARQRLPSGGAPAPAPPPAED